MFNILLQYFHLIYVMLDGLKKVSVMCEGSPHLLPCLTSLYDGHVSPNANLLSQGIVSHQTDREFQHSLPHSIHG